MTKKQVGINMLANIFSFMVSFGINFFFTPFLIKNVGIEAYSFMPMTGNFISYVMVFSTALNSMAARFITIEIHKGREEKAKSYFSTVFFCNVLLGGFFSFVFAGVVFFLEALIQIPAGVVSNIKMLFALTFLSAIISLIGSVFTVATFVKNRLDLRSMVSISESIIRAGSLIFLFLLFKPSMMLIGISVLLIALYNLVANLFLTKKLLPEIKIHRKLFEKAAVKALLGAGMWNSVNQASVILMTGFDILLANRFLNETLAGNIALSKTIPNLIFTVAALLVSAFAPQFTILYAKGEREELLKQITSSIKIVSLVMSIPLAGFVAFGKSFYALWVPTEDTGMLFALTLITMIPTFISVFVGTIKNIFPVVNKVRLPAIYVFCMGLVNLVTVLILLNLFPQYGAYIICGVSGLLLVANDLLFAPRYAAKCLGLKKSAFYPQLLKSIAATAVLTLVFWGISFVVAPNSWSSLLLAAVLCGVVGLGFNFLFMLSKGERGYVVKLMKTKILKIKR